jgi:hypothetical protein
MAPSRPEEELYDLEADPHEIVNLVGSPEHEAVLSQLRTELGRWIEDTNDLGRYPEDPAVIQYYEQRMKTLYDERIDALREQWGLPGAPLPSARDDD